MGEPTMTMTHYIVVREDAPDRFVAYPCGLPELTVTAATRADAIGAATRQLNDWFESGRLVPVRLPGFLPANGAPASANDPMQRAFEEALERSRCEDLERTLAEYATECPATASIPTT
jgi:hypothetical protein